MVEVALQTKLFQVRSAIKSGPPDPGWAIIHQELARKHVTREESGRLPDDWDQLLAEAQKESGRMQESLARVAAQEIWFFKFAPSVPQLNLSK
jgi:hypothetical protein